MKKIYSQEDLDAFISSLDWTDAFIRECYLLSPTYISPEDSGMIAANAAPMIKMLICTQDPKFAGVELILCDVDDLSLSFSCDLEPFGDYQDDFVSISFSGVVTDITRCKEFYYKILDQNCWGHKIRYGSDEIFDEGGCFDNQCLNNE